MSNITGELYLANSDWRFVYNTVLNYFNQEINIAYNEAIHFWEQNKELSSEDFLKALNESFEIKEVTDYRKSLIKHALTRAGGSKIYKPKKNNFEKYTNRTTYIDTADVRIDFHKLNRAISISTRDYDNFDVFMANNTFITEFINMINTINWPARTGPKKAVRGCSLIRTGPYDEKVIFYTSGPNPPLQPSEVPSEVVNPPKHIDAPALKSIKLTSDNAEDTFQPVPTTEDTFEGI